ncbi:ATP-binding protein [Sphingomonas sp.]|uniref:sensor histidine kinase n=1 Tax=Sphingomonas sp. TaxID=28214 RepID=UPI0025EE7B86|nr:ATP-binding protein [Sphingomonas sp.]
MLVTALGWAGLRWSLRQANAAADAAAAQAARTHVALLTSELQKFRLLPVVLAEYPDAAATLGDRSEAARDRLDRTLEQLARRTDAAAIYVVDASGTTRAASNWNTPASFVGQNYGFRPYFRDAMVKGASEFFALGTVSGRPGLYLARRIDRDGRALGVVVVKVEFDGVEAAWARTPGMSFVVDAHGVVLVTSAPSWRFLAIAPIDAATLTALRQTLQFGGNPPLPAPLSLDGPQAVVGGKTRYRVAVEPAALAGGRLLHLSPLDPPLAAARSQALIVGLGLLLVAAIVAGLLIRSAETRRLQAAAREALEEEVKRRTAELSDANARLVVQSNERVEADRRYREAREELAQANRLASLGQITAGVAHEINQPVAAIRTFAENGATLIDRAAPEKARDNLARIVELTARIGTITGELRAFARRRVGAGGEATLGSVIDGTMLLLGERARDVVSVELTNALRGVVLVGDRTRLEQVVINLVQNAIEAVADRRGGRVTITAAGDGDAITLSVADNGPGLDPAIAATLFTPFSSGKPEGLGLGLAIARDIAREFGGDIAHVAGGVGGTFVATLRAA